MRTPTNALYAAACLCALLTIGSCTDRGKKAPAETAMAPTRPPAAGDTDSAIDADILSIHQDSKGNYWFGSDGKGVYRYDGKQTVLFTDKDGLCHNQIRRIREDKAGNLYFSTGKGISRFDGRDFLTLTKGEKATAEDTAKDWEVKPDDLWFEAGDGVYRLDGGSLKYLRLPRTDNEAEYYSQFPGTPISPYAVYCTFKDSKGNIWMGTEYLGVCRYDGKSFTWFNEAEGSAVRAVFEDRNGTIWTGNSEALFRFDGARFTNFTKENGLSNPNFARTLAEKNALPSPAKEVASLASLIAIAEDRNGDLWFGTHGSGTWRYDGKKLANYSIKDGLSSKEIMAIHKDKSGGLWFGTTEGIFKFDGSTFVKFQ